jgi:hypothetical protein
MCSVHWSITGVATVARIAKALQLIDTNTAENAGDINDGDY